MKRFLGLLLLGLSPLVAAHEVHMRIEPSRAVVITLSYANGEPFAYEKYALTAAGQPTPQQVGNTDAAGRIVFLPGQHEKWQLAATSADGHGVSQEITVPIHDAAALATPAADPTPPRWLIALSGIALIFGLFGLWQLFLRRKR
ncbi:ABC transporter permease [Sulfuricystis thermophila]|uniref:ABC transporter permease n=1 Tax=Sulfuricystis thermophila TaxID=2496847 RepID=UPI00103673AA|nr:ABC transporter permease [Sulfuricystis thermophila]